jgi:site-specific recombinase XerC
MREARKTKVQPSQMNRKKSRPKRRPAERYTKDSYCRAIARGVKLADKAAHKKQPEIQADAVLVKRWHPNQLRHSVATSIRKRFGLEAAQVTLGHSKADVTQIYAERDWQKAEQVMREVG